MSDFGNLPRLVPAASQLPVHAYHDQRLFDLEMRTLFADAPGYVGHELMVPAVGDYHTLAWAGDARTLVRNGSGVNLLSNVCRHRQAIMLGGRGNRANIVCPLHRWTYDLEGRLLGAPHFDDKPRADLRRLPLRAWNGLLFSGPRDIDADLAGLGVRDDLDFSGYMFDRVEIHECAYNWKTFIEVYLEDYHVAPFHPGLGGFVTCDDLRWQYGKRFSVQTVGINSALARPGSAVYGRWHDQVLKYRRERFDDPVPKYGAIWLTLYPNIMVEWYPHVLVVSHLIPRGPQATTNVVEFYYPEEIVLFEREFVEAEQAAYMETAREDDEIALRMDAGRLALMREGVNETGPYQSPMEDGMQHFHEFLRRELGDGAFSQR
ncbi:MAG: aromatic ring-hydroxylating dioxygenase subunit alpha [Burkholderiales bacterium]|nr:aromatic ring-hydroxylating dioxygenase subunit alpha [Burkholderiales bacterium]